MTGTTVASRLLDVIELDILPLTERGVASGNKVFGAALLNKADLSVVVAGTNDETDNPLWHGEINTLRQFYEMPDRPSTRDLLFLTTHEPCTLCMSAITWAGFDNYYYFYSHEDSRDAFAIPHDLKILREVFGLEPGGYRRTNEFWTAYAIGDLIDAEPEPLYTQLREQRERIRSRSAELAARSDDVNLTGQAWRLAQPHVAGEQRDVEITRERDVERVVVRQVLPQRPGTLRQLTDMRVATFDDLPGHHQRGKGLGSTYRSRKFVAAQHIPDLRVDKMRRVQSHLRHPPPQSVGTSCLSDKRQHQRRRIDDAVGHRRSAERSAMTEARVAPGVSLASRTAAIAANASSTVGADAKSMSQSRRYD